MSRSIKIIEVSKSVAGAFELYDALSISTMSGPIDITIIPQPASPSSTAPAELHLNTCSGSIRVKMAPLFPNRPSLLPKRIFRSSINSMSGSITASLFHNYKTSLSTMSGHINASIYPLRQPSWMSQVDLHCISGSASMTLHPYGDSPQASIEMLSADCRSSTGGLKIRFPSTWEGKIISNVDKGRVRHEWEGLQVLDNRPYFTAIKGNGSGTLSITGATVNVELADWPGLPMEGAAKGEGERVPVIPGMPSLLREVEAQEGELKPEGPKEGESQQKGNEKNDDEWAIVEDEGGV